MTLQSCSARRRSQFQNGSAYVITILPVFDDLLLQGLIILNTPSKCGFPQVTSVEMDIRAWQAGTHNESVVLVSILESIVNFASTAVVTDHSAVYWWLPDARFDQYDLQGVKEIVSSAVADSRRSVLTMVPSKVRIVSLSDFKGIDRPIAVVIVWSAYASLATIPSWRTMKEHLLMACTSLVWVHVHVVHPS